MKFSLILVILSALLINHIELSDSTNSPKSKRLINFFSTFPYYQYFKDLESFVDNVVGRVECLFIVPFRSLSCSGPFSIVECEALGNFNNFNLAFMAVGLNNNSSELPLYPRTIENSKWLNHTIWSNEKFIRFSLYNSESNKDFGINVRSESCFQDIIQMFNSTKSTSVIRLNEDESFRFNSSNVTTFGNIFIRY